MTETQISKVKQFLSDKEMNATVKGVLRDKFLERKNTDVHYLAAQTLAVQFLEDAWLGMDRYRQSESQAKQERQIGL